MTNSHSDKSRNTGGSTKDPTGPTSNCLARGLNSNQQASLMCRGSPRTPSAQEPTEACKSLYNFSWVIQVLCLRVPNCLIRYLWTWITNHTRKVYPTPLLTQSHGKGAEASMGNVRPASSASNPNLILTVTLTLNLSLCITLTQTQDPKIPPVGWTVLINQLLKSQSLLGIR